MGPPAPGTSLGGKGQPLALTLSSCCADPEFPRAGHCSSLFPVSTPIYPFRETPMPAPWEGTELSFYVQEGPGMPVFHTLHRHSIRLDGFASYHADYDIKKVTTKSILFTGNELHLNFSTSALGWIYVDVLDANNKPLEGWHSCELFGNTTDRTVYFGDSKDVSSLQGHVIRLRFTMRQADLYSYKFE